MEPVEAILIVICLLCFATIVWAVCPNIRREEQRARNRKNLPPSVNRKNAGRRELTFLHRILGKVDISSCCD